MLMHWHPHWHSCVLMLMHWHPHWHSCVLMLMHWHPHWHSWVLMLMNALALNLPIWLSCLFILFTDNIFHTSCGEVIKSNPEKLKKAIAVKFQGEDGMVCVCDMRCRLVLVSHLLLTHRIQACTQPSKEGVVKLNPLQYA